MSLLVAFEAAARHASFTAAAVELNLTQSAVSRQIRHLEQVLGSDLFIRERQTVRLTVAGEAYANEVRQVLQRLATASLGFRANPDGGSLDLAILPTFGTRWLAPRLPRFLARHAGITINLTTRLVPFDFAFDSVDAAIHFGAPSWSGAELDFLMSETLIPVCSPALHETFAFRVPEDLLAAPLLHLVSRPDAWERWFTTMNVAFEEIHGMLIDQVAVAAQAANAGMGVALLPKFLISNELARGELIEAIDAPMVSAESYYLASPVNRADYPPLKLFRAWLGEEARDAG